MIIFYLFPKISKKYFYSFFGTAISTALWTAIRSIRSIHLLHLSTPSIHSVHPLHPPPILLLHPSTGSIRSIHHSHPDFFLPKLQQKWRLSGFFMGYICLTSKNCFEHLIAAWTQNTEDTQKSKYSTKNFDSKPNIARSSSLLYGLLLSALD